MRLTAITTPNSLADRVGISTISFRHNPLKEALGLIRDLSATEIDLGAIPDVTDHVPVPFDGNVHDYVDLLAAYGLRSGAVNADVGHLNDPGLGREVLEALTTPLVALAAATGGALIVPCGRNTWQPYADERADLALIADNLRFLASLCERQDVRLLVEMLHHKRWIHSVERADDLLSMVGSDVFGIVFDVSHIVASSEDPVAWAAQCAGRIERVHLRDAVPGNLNIGIGRGDVDFTAIIRTLEEKAFTGSYILELETHDVRERDRVADARRNRESIVGVLESTATS